MILPGHRWAVDTSFGRADVLGAWRRLADARVNYSPDEVREPDWKIDTYRVPLPPERPGAPEPGGCWERACRLIRDYEFSPPEIVRALFDPAAPLLGRDMLLEARFHGLRFHCGVRVTEVVDETRGRGDRVWGWGYETLEGHLERGKAVYEVAKNQQTGQVRFLVTCHSQAAPTLGPVTSLGWRLFGRRTQVRFYLRCGERLRQFVTTALSGEDPLPGRPVTAGHLVRAPSDAEVRRLDVLTVHRVAPG